MDILKLEYFVSVAKYLNFTKAAKEHHIAQTAMSRQIASLEDEIGIPLFIRNNRKVELTSAGELLYYEATNFLQSFNRTIAIVKHTFEKKTGLLKIGIGTYDRYIASDIMRNFSSLYPQIEITVDQYDYRTLSDKLVDGHLDLIFCINKYTDICEDIATIKIFEEPWSLAVNVKHEWASKDVIKREELKGQDLITMNDGSQAESRSIPFPSFDLNERIHVNSLDAKLLILESNLGVTIIPAFLKGISPNIKLIAIDPPLVPRIFVVAYLQSNNNPSMKLFLSSLKNGKNT